MSSSPNAKTLLHLTLFRLHSLEAQKNFSDLKNSHRLPPLRKFSNEASFFIELSRGVQWLNQKIVPEYQQGSHWKGSSANYSFSDTPFHPYGRKWKTLKRVICYFPTHIFNGGGKSSSVLRFFSKFCQNSTLYNSTPLTQSPCSAFILHTEMGKISKVKMGLRSKISGRE